LSPFIEALAASGAPEHMLAALEMLTFRHSSAGRVALLPDNQRQRFFQWCDERQLTLLLSHLGGSQLPDWARHAITPKEAHYELRFERIKRELAEIVEAFDDAKLEFVMLKGLSHSPALTPDARHRAQGDIDLWLLGPSVYKAQDVLSGLGYVSLRGAKSRHLAPMGKPSSWVWRGDMFDPEMPISVELHYELWSDRAEYIRVPGLEQFWERKRLRAFDGHSINVLCDEDLIGFATLHLLLHLLHGELPLQRAWEIGNFLNMRAQDEPFWRSWQSLHPAPLRQLEVCIFRLVSNWFEWQPRHEWEADIQHLPKLVRSWLEERSLDPIKREWKPNKSEIWLHLGFIDNYRGKARVLARRLLPMSVPTFIDQGGASTPLAAKLQNLWQQLPMLMKRFVRHTVTFFPTLFDGLRLLWARRF
jgi:hypothetical protein